MYLLFQGFIIQCLYRYCYNKSSQNSNGSMDIFDILRKAMPKHLLTSFLKGKSEWFCQIFELNGKIFTSWKNSPLIIVEKLSKKTHLEQTLVAQILFIITFPVIVNNHPVTNLVIVYKVPTSVKNFANVVQTALIGSQDVGVKHSVTPNRYKYFP